MQLCVLGKLPTRLFEDLPGEVRDALDTYLDDKQSMLNMTERYISGHDLSRSTYYPIIKGLKHRKQTSLRELREQAAKHCPKFDLAGRLAEIGQFLHYQQVIEPRLANRLSLLQRYLSEPYGRIPTLLLT